MQVIIFFKLVCNCFFYECIRLMCPYLVRHFYLRFLHFFNLQLYTVFIYFFSVSIVANFTVDKIDLIKSYLRHCLVEHQFLCCLATAALGIQRITHTVS